MYSIKLTMISDEHWYGLAADGFTDLRTAFMTAAQAHFPANGKLPRRQNHRRGTRPAPPQTNHPTNEKTDTFLQNS